MVVVIVLMMIIVGMHPQNIITTIAGTGIWGISGDGGAATSAQFALPSGVSVDISGNVYIADTNNYRIRMVNSAGIITTFAGTGDGGSSGDGGAATSATLFGPRGVSVDISGNVYIADSWNNMIRMVTSTGIITTIAGTGTRGSSGDGGAATSAQLYWPYGVSVDISGNVYIADYRINKIRMVNSAGIITAFAGTGDGGSSGDGGAATSAQLYGPQGVSVDISGNVYIADYYNNKIRMVNSTGIITTFAGTGDSGSSGDGGAATSAQLNQAFGVSVDISGNVYIADSANHKIRMVNSTGIITTIAGGAYGISGDVSAATSAQLYYPSGVSVDISGNVYITDTGNNKVRKLGRVLTLPTSQPSRLPSLQPTRQPSMQPTSQPTRQPTQRPTLYSKVMTYQYTGTVQTYAVPVGVTLIQVSAAGAAGGGGYNSGAWSTGGLGGYISTLLSVVPGQVYYVMVGGMGASRDSNYNVAHNSGGYNGGGSCTNPNSGEGGGGTDLRTTANDITTRVVVSGGGELTSPYY